MRIYYAHCIAIYDTPQEQRDIETLQQLGFEVVNPNCPESANGYKVLGMEYFRQFADTCDAIAFRALPGGSVPAGVFAEIGIFRDKGKPVIELPSSINLREMSVEETREYIRECGAR
jgi:hypothetical protein